MTAQHNARRLTHIHGKINYMTNDIRPESSPLGIPVAQIAGRAGQSKLIDADFPAPSGIGDEIINVSEGASVHVDGSIDSIVDGLIFNATVTAPVTSECTRCLKRLDGDHTIHVTAFFPFAEDDRKSRRNDDDEVEIIAGEEESEDTYPLLLNNTYMDIEALLRDNLVESLPVQQLCRPDCQGLCPQCGEDLNEHPDHHHETINMRWSALEEFKAKLEAQEKNGSNGTL